MRRRDGSILIIALWSLAILSLMAVGAGYAAWTESRLGAAQVDRLRNQRLMQAGLEVARRLLPTPGQAFVSFKDDWAQRTTAFKGVALAEGTFSLRRSAGDGSEGWGLEDEQGRINLNSAPLAMLQRLLEGDAELAAAIVDWRGTGSAESAEKRNAHYGALPRPYAGKQAPFESVEELLLVQGMTPDIYARIRRRVTVYTNGLVNLNTAPPAVLEALGFGESLVKRVVEFRRGPDGMEGTEDDGLFTAVGAAAAELEKSGSLSVEERNAFAGAQSFLTVRSGCFRARFELAPGGRALAEGGRAELVLAATGLQNQWVIRHYTDPF